MGLEKKSFKKGEFLCYQYGKPDELFILLSGQLEVLASVEPTENNKQLIEQSSRIAIIDTPKTPFGEISFILKQPRTASIKALTDCVCAVFKGTQSDLNNLIKTNPQIGISIALTVIKRFKKCKEIIINANKLYKEMQSLYDNYSFAYYKLIKASKELSTIQKEHSKDFVFKHGKDLDEKIINSGGQSPKQLPLPLLETDLSKKFNKSYSLPQFESPGTIDYELALFFENLLSLNVNFLNTIMSNKPYVIYYMSEKLVRFISIFNSRALEAEKFVETQLNLLIGTNGCFSMIYNFYKQLQSAGAGNLTFFDRLINNLAKNLKNKLDKYIDIWGKPFSKMDSNFKTQLEELLKLEQKKDEIKKEQRKQFKIQSSDFDITGQYDKVKDLHYIDDKIKSELINSYTNYSSLTDKFEVGGETRKIKRAFADKHWNFVKEVYKKMLTEENIEQNEFYLLRFNILDEFLLNDSIINALKLVDQNAASSKYPIYYIDEWISQIYLETEEPSINEMGQTYSDYLKEINKKGITPTENHNWSLAQYEIESMLTVAVKTCAGTLSSQVPVLDKDFITGNPEQTLLNKKRLEKILDKILEKTFSLFYREVRLIYEDDKIDYIKKSITPNFIFIPIAGSKVVCWQEIVGTNKSSRGRILVPLFPTENIEEMLLTGLANYYWELNKTMAGYSWGDPIDGGVTGKYFDYTSTYKQSKDLSEEARKKLSEFFKKYSTTKDKFAAEYMLWWNYEAEGIVKLNKLSREIFYNYVPLSKKYRDKLATFPVFEKFSTRFNNLALKELKQIENKIKRLENANLSVPRELKEALKFYEI